VREYRRDPRKGQLKLGVKKSTVCEWLRRTAQQVNNPTHSLAWVIIFPREDPILETLTPIIYNSQQKDESWFRQAENT
jgi:hypothetical protein